LKPKTGDRSKSTATGPLSGAELDKLDAYWRASNYLSVGQIYLLDNPLLKAPLKREHIKPRLLGHWGTSPGLNMLCVHLNRIIMRDDLNVIYIIGPGHGGPSLVAHAYLEGTYSETYPNISQDAEGMKKLFKQFSFPGGIPSHVAPETPGSIHEGGELGYALSHAYGAAFDNPDLIVACVVGDGEAETGPLATGWHGIEMAEEAGEENFFLFGLTADQVAGSRGWYNPHWHYDNEPECRAALDLIFSDLFSRNEPGVFAELRDTLLTHGDHYMHLADLKSYLAVDQDLVKLYGDVDGWARMAILNVAGSGKFSSDRTIAEYAADIWGAEPCPVP
jgi:XFP N-terminal domain/Carbohydrate phosphorylase